MLTVPLLVGFVFRMKQPELGNGQEYTLGNLKDLSFLLLHFLAV